MEVEQEKNYLAYRANAEHHLAARANVSINDPVDPGTFTCGNQILQKRFHKLQCLERHLTIFSLLFFEHRSFDLGSSLISATRRRRVSPRWPPPYIRSWWASSWPLSWVWPLWVDWTLGLQVKLWPRSPPTTWPQTHQCYQRRRWQHPRQKRTTKRLHLAGTDAGVTTMSWVSGTLLSTVTQASTCSAAAPASTASAASSKSTVWTRLPVPTTTHPSGQTPGDRQHQSQKSMRSQTEIGPTWSCILSVEWWPSWCWWGFSPSSG